METRNVIIATIATAFVGAIATVVTGILAYQAGLRNVEKDYVVISAGILGNPSSDKQLRLWAIEVMDRLAPVKFSSELRDTLATPGSFAALRVEPPKIALEPCIGPAIRPDRKDGGLSQQGVELLLLQDATALATCEAKRRALVEAWPR